MKYVAFLDILGYKEKLKSLNQQEAKQFISDFSSVAYQVWEKFNSPLLNGYIVSDSFIIYSNDVSINALDDIVKIVDQICKAEFSKNSIFIRGAIAKGEFDKLNATELSTLSKGLIVGQAYIDAYLLEGTVKTTGIVLSEKVYQDIEMIYKYSQDIFKENGQKTTYCVYRYLSLDYLLEKENLEKFVSLASKSKWIPHYYNTLYFALKNEKGENRVDQFFINLFDLISKDKPSENWREIDTCIKNSFSDNVIPEYQKRFLKYLRSKIFQQNLY